MAAGPLRHPHADTISTPQASGKIYVTGVGSGLGLFQSDEVFGDKANNVDLSNGMVIVQKIDGLVQFYAQGGVYSLPALGTNYHITQRMSVAENNFFSAFPEGYLKLVPTDTFSIEAGKLPSLIGDEYTFTFQNMNIERGLLWNLEPAISRGVQANLTTGPVAWAASVNDGFYSDRYTWVSGSATWTIDSADTLVLAAGGNFNKANVNTDRRSIPARQWRCRQPDLHLQRGAVDDQPVLPVHQQLAQLDLHDQSDNWKALYQGRVDLGRRGAGQLQHQ